MSLALLLHCIAPTLLLLPMRFPSALFLVPMLLGLPFFWLHVSSCATLYTTCIILLR